MKISPHFFLILTCKKLQNLVIFTPVSHGPVKKTNTAHKTTDFHFMYFLVKPPKPVSDYWVSGSELNIFKWDTHIISQLVFSRIHPKNFCKIRLKPFFQIVNFPLVITFEPLWIFLFDICKLLTGEPVSNEPKAAWTVTICMLLQLFSDYFLKINEQGEKSV